MKVERRTIIGLLISGLSFFSVGLAGTGDAQAADTLDETPRGAGSQVGDPAVGDHDRVREGFTLAGFAGVGYGVGAGARIGYSFRPGVYLGGAYTYYSGNASMLGGELGYKLFLSSRWELMPYVFGGAAFVREGDSGFGRDSAETVGAFQPGVVGAYHFGPAFLFADARAYVTPSPGALALLGGVGVTL
ncbi:MAG: hypothetical protein QM784_08385 [Polyangiaceae bacterium]